MERIRLEIAKRAFVWATRDAVEGRAHRNTFLDTIRVLAEEQHPGHLFCLAAPAAQGGERPLAGMQVLIATPGPGETRRRFIYRGLPLEVRLICGGDVDALIDAHRRRADRAALDRLAKAVHVSGARRLSVQMVSRARIALSDGPERPSASSLDGHLRELTEGLFVLSATAPTSDYAFRSAGFATEIAALTIRTISGWRCARADDVLAGLRALPGSPTRDIALRLVTLVGSAPAREFLDTAFALLDALGGPRWAQPTPPRV